MQKYYSATADRSQTKSEKILENDPYYNTPPSQNHQKRSEKHKLKRYNYLLAGLLSVINLPQFFATIQFESYNPSLIADFWTSLRKRAEYFCKKNDLHLSAFGKCELTAGGRFHIHILIKTDAENAEEIFTNLVLKAGSGTSCRLKYFEPIKNFEAVARYIHNQHMPVGARTTYTFGNFFEKIAVSQRRELTWIKWHGANYLTPEERKAQYIHQEQNKPHFKPPEEEPEAAIPVEKEISPLKGNCWSLCNGPRKWHNIHNKPAILKIYSSFWDTA